MVERNDLDAYDKDADRYLGEDRSAAIAAADVSEREHFCQLLAAKLNIETQVENRGTPAFLKVPTCE